MSNHIDRFRRRQILAQAGDLFATFSAAAGLVLGVLAIVA